MGMPMPRDNIAISRASTTPAISTAKGSQGYCFSQFSTTGGTPCGIAAPATVSTVTTPGGTVLGGALVTCPAFTRSSNLPGVSVAVKGNWRINRPPGRITRRIIVEVSTGGTSVVWHRVATVPA